MNGCMKTAGKRQKSGSGAQDIGVLDVGDNIRGLKQRARLNRSEADGPVATPGGARHADDVEIDVPAQRMPLQGVADANSDLVECGRRLCEIFFEIHRASLPSELPRGGLCSARILGTVWLMAR